MNEIEKFIENTAPTSSEKLALLRKYRASPLPVGTIVRRSEGPDPFVTKTSPPNVLVGETSVDISQGGSGAASKSGTALIVTPEKSNRSEAWEAIDDELRTAVHEYERLSATLLPGHERMRELKKNIDAATHALDLEWANAMGSFGLEKAHIEQRLEDLQKQMPEYRQLIAAYDDYRRDFKLESSGRLAWEQAYVTMKARLTAMDYTGPEVQVNFLFQGFTDVRDDVPVSPNKKKLLNYALILSVGLGLGAPFLTERMRFTSSFVTEAEKYCRYATCGVVPLLHAELLGINGYIGDRRTNARKSSHADESFRIIRNSLTFHAPAGNLAQALMVTSSRPNDGKSTIAEHLARSFAEAGERVLLLDADLRRGSLQKEFGVGASAPGLFELLAGKLVFDEVVVDTGIPNLSIVTRGLDTNRDYDLLSGKNLGQLIESLRERFDRIILDTPPMLGVADSLIIAKVVDGVLFVIRSDETTQRDIATAAEMLHHTGAVVYGFVLNGVDFSRRENSYYYGSYYARYYEPSYYTLEHPDNSKKIPSNLDY
jgi:capsular exopolysaccharide synthesis family protein